MKALVFAGSTRQRSFKRRLAQAAAGIPRELSPVAPLSNWPTTRPRSRHDDLDVRGVPPAAMRLKQPMFEHPAWAGERLAAG